MNEPPQVRGHHLLCLLTYVGRGYSPAFIAAMDALASHVAGGGPVVLRVGPDVLCGALLSTASDCHKHCQLARNAERDRVALREIAALLRRPLQPGAPFVLTAGDIAAMRQVLQELDVQAATSNMRAACRGCEWLNLCREVTASHFVQARIGMTKPASPVNERRA